VEAVSRKLAEERRLFYVAVTRARRCLLVTAVRDEENQPSRFLDELMPWTGDEDERPLTRVPRGLDLPAVVAELRAVVCAPTGDASDGGAPVSEARRRAAAYQLARLAAAGVRGADPDEWYALPPLSDDAPLRRPDQPVRVSPSRIEAYHRCALRWLLEGSGGTTGSGLGQAIGVLVHGLAHDVAVGKLGVDGLLEEFERRWPSVDAGSGWYARREHDRVRTMVEKLADWLRADERELVAAEADFQVRVGRALLRGTVDRLDRNPDGSLVVVDFKTGKTAVPREELARHPQLGVYQVAVEEGGLAELTGPDPTVDGAALVQLGTDSRSAAEQRQPPLAQDEDPGWARRLIEEAADGMAGAEFPATANRLCVVCPVRRGCPLRAEGGQVTP